VARSSADLRSGLSCSVSALGKGRHAAVVAVWTRRAWLRRSRTQESYGTAQAWCVERLGRDGVRGLWSCGEAFLLLAGQRNLSVVCSASAHSVMEFTEQNQGVVRLGIRAAWGMALQGDGGTSLLRTMRREAPCRHRRVVVGVIRGRRGSGASRSAPFRPYPGLTSPRSPARNSCYLPQAARRRSSARRTHPCTRTAASRCSS